ncbi:MAG: NAD(P)/FAD-dependent oxidoreductase [Candidatus Krumholzibacteriia bacterium]
MASASRAASTGAAEHHRRPRIVIVGGGFGGATCAQKLIRRFDRDEAEVVLLDRNNFFVFYPFLVEAGTGALSPRHAVVGLRAFTRGGRFVMGEFVDADLEAQRIRYRPVGSPEPVEMDYDHLVLGLGSVTKLPPVPGLAEHGFGIKSIGDAIDLRDRAIRLLEQADITEDPHLRRSLLHFVVVGGNFTGVELVGELQVFLRRATRHYRNIAAGDIRMTLVEIADDILPGFDRDLSQFAVGSLRKRGIDVRLETTVSRIEERRVVLDPEEELHAATVIWAAGIAPSPVTQRLDLARDDRGWLLCDPELRVQKHERVWALGDCAVNPDPQGDPYPATAQHAVGQGKALADNLLRVLRGQEPRPCVIESRGSLVALGCRTGVARVLGIKLSGFPAWFLWRTVYLTKMPGWGRRARVALDWTVDLLFGRDDVQMGWREPWPVARKQARGGESVGLDPGGATAQPEGS